tara:strand:- start:37 stop:1053 length:1017 start_codon:yes stop_codon:yes gene_type:complete
MAINTSAYSPKQFSFLIAMQDDWGTINENTGGSPDNPWLAVDVDSVGSPSLNLNQTLDPRTGSRVLQATDFFQDKLNKVIELSVSGTATTEVLDVLLGNITQGDTVPYLITSAGAVQNLSSATSSQTANQILSIAYKSPASGHAIGLKDCFCTAISFNGDAGTEGGRVKFSATFKTGSAPILNQADIAIDTAISANNYYMSGWDADDRIIAGHANMLVNSFTLNIENDVTFAGLTATGFESASRVSEVSATADFNVKYDDNTDVMFENFHDQATGASEGATLMATDATPSNGEFEFKLAGSVITSVAFSEGDMMSLDVSVKAVGSGIGSSTALFEIAC